MTSTPLLHRRREEGSRPGNICPGAVREKQARQLSAWVNAEVEQEDARTLALTALLWSAVTPRQSRRWTVRRQMKGEQRSSDDELNPVSVRDKSTMMCEEISDLHPHGVCRGSDLHLQGSVIEIHSSKREQRLSLLLDYLIAYTNPTFPVSVPK